MPEPGAPRNWLNSQFDVIGGESLWGNPSTGGHFVSGRGKATLSPETGVLILPWGNFYSDFIATGEKLHRKKGGVFLLRLNSKASIRQAQAYFFLPLWAFSPSLKQWRVPIANSAAAH